MGLLEGLRAGLLTKVDFAAALACVLVAAGAAGVIGSALGAATGAIARLVRWGRAVEVPLRWHVVAWVVFGALTSGVAAAAVAATGLRHNRFLAAGVTVLAALVTGTIAAALSSVLARVLGSPRAGRDRESTLEGGVVALARTSTLEGRGRRASWAGVMVIAPAVALAVGGLAFWVVAGARAPLRGARLLNVQLAMAVMALLPAALAMASTSLARVRRRWAITAAGLLYGLPGSALVARRWHSDFQYLRWNDIAVLLAIAVTAALLIRFAAGRLRVRRRVAAALVVSVGSFILFLTAGTSEPARKAAGTHAGLVAPALGAARLAFDLDRDGYTSVLGGGDCADREPDINPGAQEWPGDGVDQDCDGKDVVATVVRAPGLHEVPESVPKDLNVLLVTIDTLRADHLGAYGYSRPTSPVMDQLGTEGIVFENGWAHAPSTRYSMPALATGRWPSTIAWQECVACDRGWPRMAPEQRTLGEAFKSNGYVTGAYYAFSYFKREYRRGFERGIDDFQDHRADLHRDLNGPVESAGSSARQIADDAIKFVHAHRQAKWFLWLHFYDPHLGYEPHPEVPSFGARPEDLYDGEIRFTDTNLGRVLDAVREAGGAERTAVFVTGDHGEGFGEKGISAHGYHLYPPQTKVPFIARVPGLAARRISTPVGHVDIAPTLINLARGKAEASFLGRSMVDLMTGRPSAREAAPGPVFQEVTFEGPTSPIDGTRRRGLVTGQHHLIWNWMPDNTTECYDLAADPGELRDLWGQAAGAACVPLKQRLQELVQVFSLPLDLGERLARAVSSPGASAPVPKHGLDARFGTSVRFLGYDLASASVARGPDSELEVVYHFECLERVPAGWRPFFHLEGPRGMLNLDHVPVEGGYPVERWRPGQRIRDRQRIPIPESLAPGRYTLYVGFFKRGDRMPITPPEHADSASRLRVLSFEVR